MRHLQLSLLLATAVMATSLPVRAQQSDSAAGQSSVPQQTVQTAQSTSSGSVDFISVGASIINSLINPPSKSAEIAADAEVKKAKIAAEAEIAKEKLRIEASKSADKVTPVLSQWGVTRVACAPGVAVVNGITTEAVCVQPTNAMPAGYYTYNSAKQQLVRNSGGAQNSGSAPAPTTNNAQNPGVNKTQSSVETSVTQNGQTIRNEQTTRINSTSGGRRPTGGGGF